MSARLLISMMLAWCRRQHCAARRQQGRRYTENLLWMKKKASLMDLLLPYREPEIGCFPDGVHRPSDVWPHTLLHSLSPATLLSHMTLAFQVIVVP